MAIKYIPYYPNTLEGQAILNNFVRTQRVLRYRDNDKVVERIQRGMPLYEMETIEQVGDNPDQNKVIRGECLSACAYLKDQGVKVDLVYIDPPFASGADYAKKVYIRRNPKVAEAIQQAESELDSDELRNFEEKMYGDIWDKERYLNWMYENLMAIKSVMSDSASIYVHLDYHIGHYVKILLDEIFGEDNFRNEIIWHYYNKMQGNVKRFASNHDSIYLYSKSDQFNFLPIKEKRESSTKQIKREWNKEKQKLVNAKDNNGKVIYIDTDEKTIDDVWRLPMLQPADKEEPVDYATQKPEALLERIINASSDKGMLVADFFGGSGVTATVASKLGRRFVHCDVGVNSIETTRDRLVKAKAQFEVLEIKDGVSLYRNPVQTMDKLKNLIPGLQNNDQLDKSWAGSINSSSYGSMPVYLPNLLDSSTRLLDTAQINHIIREAMPDLTEETKRVIVYYIDIADRDEIDQFIKEQNDTGIEIELRDLKNVLDNVVVEDSCDYSLAHVQPEGQMFQVWQVTINSFCSDCVLKKIEEYNIKGQVQAQTSRKSAAFKPIVISDEGLETIEWLSLDSTTDDAKAPWHSDSEILIEKNSKVRLNGVVTQNFWDGTISSEKKPLRMKIRNICGDETVFILSGDQTK